MTETAYTKEQVSNAKRLMDVIASIPTDRQPEITRMVEAMILGAEMADRLSTDTAKP